MTPQLEIHGRPLPPDDVILDSMAVAVLALDTSCHIIRFNRTAERLTGHYRSKMVGQRCDRILEASPCGPSCPVQQVLNTGAPCLQHSITIHTSDLQRITVEALASPLLGPRDKVIGVVVVLCQDSALVKESASDAVSLSIQQAFHEKNVVVQALESAEGNITRAAKSLGIHRTTLWRKIQRLGIKL